MPLETESLYLINDGVPCGAAAPSPMKFSRCFQYPSRDHKWQKTLDGFCCSIFSFRGKTVVWLDAYGVSCSVISGQCEKPSGSGRVLRRPVSPGLGPRTLCGDSSCHSKDHFTSALRAVRELVCIYSTVRKAATHWENSS